MDPSLIYYVGVRCHTCGKVLGDKQIPYENLLQTVNQETGSYYTPEEAMDALKLNRYCCRMRLMAPGQLPLGSALLEPIETSLSNLYLAPNLTTAQPGEFPATPKRVYSLSDETRRGKVRQSTMYERVSRKINPLTGERYTTEEAWELIESTINPKTGRPYTKQEAMML